MLKSMFLAGVFLVVIGCSGCAGPHGTGSDPLPSGESKIGAAPANTEPTPQGKRGQTDNDSNYRPPPKGFSWMTYHGAGFLKPDNWHDIEKSSWDGQKKVSSGKTKIKIPSGEYAISPGQFGENWRHSSTVFKVSVLHDIKKTSDIEATAVVGKMFLLPIFESIQSKDLITYEDGKQQSQKIVSSIRHNGNS